MEKPNEAVVASIDVLGMGSILSNDKLEYASRIICHLWANTIYQFAFLGEDFKGGKIPLFMKSTLFGDSIFIMGDPEKTIEQQAKGIVVRVASLIAIGILGDNIFKQRFFLRCGIARGNLVYKTCGFSEADNNIPQELHDKHEEIAIGNAMVRAHFLQIQQNWIGGAISNDIDCKNFKDYLVEYDVPLKENKHYDKDIIPKLAINWIKIAQDNEKFLKVDLTKINEKIVTIAEFIGNIEEKNIQEKIENTKRFVNTILGN